MNKQSFKYVSKTLVIAGLVALSFITKVSAQNLILNPGFENGTTNWTTECTMEINPENVYGGANNGNRVTEVDVERCFSQQVNVTAGSTYYFSYKASRRQGGPTPATVGAKVTVTGVQSGTQYINVNRTYNNAPWSYTTEVFSFTLALNSTDTKVNVKFANHLTAGTYGTLIDDVSVVVGSAGTLPLKFLTFGGKMKNNSAVLSWTASNDDHTGKYFIVEKSVGQNKFDSIGSVKANDTRTDYSFTDNSASTGTNYYRIKAVNANGAVSYTNVIVLNNNSNTSAKVYPNPAVSTIAVTLSGVSKATATVQIFNLAGNLVMSKQVSISEGANVFSIDVTSLKPGSFFLKVSAERELTFAQSFCKR